MEVVTLFFTSKFNSEDVPMTETVLNKYSTTETQTLTELNDAKAAERTIRINTPRNDLNSLRYIKSGSSLFYEVQGYNILNPRVVELSLTIAPFLNGWVGYYTNGQYKIDGVISRESHKDGDPVNLLAEPYSPEGLQNVSVVSAGYPNVGTNNTYTMSTIDLVSGEALTQNEKILTTYSGDDKLLSYEIQPRKIRSNGGQTYFKINLPYTNDTTNDWAFNGMRVFKNIDSGKLAEIAALGLENTIKYNWIVPSNYVKESKVNDNSKDLLRMDGTYRGPLAMNLDTAGEYNDSMNLKNLKAKYYSLNVHIIAKGSGDSKVFRWTDIINSSNVYSASLDVFSDPSPDGAPYMCSRFYKGSSQGYLWELTTIRGATWVKPGINFQGKSGRLLADFQTAEQIANINQNYASNLISGIAKAGAGIAAGDAGSVASGIATIAGGTLQNVSAENQAKNARNISNAIYTPTYTPADLSSIAASIPNNFLVYTTRWSNDDIKKFDQYLTRYGWAQSKTYNAEGFGESYDGEFNGRGDDFCFVQFSDVRITSTGTSKINNYLAPIMERRLLNGVRFWRN